MKQIQKNEYVGGDAAIDRLLRTGTGRKQDPSICGGFDPDLATAYAERVLRPSERTRYESHLAECAPCRKTVTALMGSADRPTITVASDVSARAGIRRVFESLLTPRWAMAAAALIILGLSLPLLLSRSQRRSVVLSDRPAAQAEPSPVAASRSAFDAASESLSKDKAEAGDVARVAGAYSVPSQPPAAAPERKGDRQTASRLVDLRKSNGNQVAAEAVDQLARAAPAKEQTEDAKAPAPKAPATPAEDAQPVTRQAQAGGEGGAVRASGQAQENEPKLARLDEKEAQRLPQEEKDSAKVTVLKQGRADGEQRQGKPATIRPEDAAPPSAPTSSVELRARRGLAQSAARLSMRDGRMNETARAPGGSRDERKVGGKRFFLREEVWTDKDYNPLKELPVVTIVRDSDVYREVISKRTGLKSYFSGFGDRERVIVVYKGTVYRLIPQDASK